MCHTDAVKDMPRIHVREPNHYYTFELPVTPGEEVVVGAAPSCKLSLPGVQGLSPTHARIVCQVGGYVIEDLQSQAGTLLGGRPVRVEFMTPGAEYMLGAVSIVLEPDAAAAQPVQQPVAQPTPQPTQESKAPEQSEQAPVKRKVNTGGTATRPAVGGAIQDMVKKYDRTKGGGKAVLIYVIILLLLAFYAGIALRHWERTGNYLPGIRADGQ